MLLEIIEQTKETNSPGLLFFTDFEKAFDSINHDYLIKVLEFFNFGQSLINWIKVFYNDVCSCIHNNGYLSDFFTIKRGVRQGCPLSPYLFIIGIEILSYAIRNNNNIKGIEINGTEVKNTLFADDETLILNGTEESFKTAVYTLEEFRNLSGLKLNPSKCNVLRIGSLKNTDIHYVRNKPFQWTSKSAKTLGTIFHTDKDKILSLNLYPKIDEFKNCLDTWKKRKLTTLGKITVVKSFALPKLIFPLTTSEKSPNNVILDLKRTMNEFIWDSKVNKVSHYTTIQDYNNAGIKMIDIESFIHAIKASWVKRIIDRENIGHWKLKYLEIMEKIGGEFFFSCNCHFSNINHLILNKFLRDVLISWCKINYSEPNSFKTEILWNNSKIVDRKIPFMYKSWLDKGIRYVYHLVEGTRFLTFHELLQKYNIDRNDFIKYHRLVSGIPKSWKQDIKHGNDFVILKEPLINKIISIRKPCKLLYNIQINKIKQNVKAHAKWETMFENYEIDWGTIHTIPFKCTIDTKLRNFQYKFLMRVIPTNKFLFKCSKVSTNLCDFCYQHIETQAHLFYECYIVQEFWNQFRNYLTENGMNMNVTKENIFLGICEKDRDFVNFLIICAKHYIYCCKYRLAHPTIQGFKNTIKQKEHIEKLIALHNNCYEKHARKWSVIKSTTTDITTTTTTTTTTITTATTTLLTPPP